MRRGRCLREIHGFGEAVCIAGRRGEQNSSSHSPPLICRFPRRTFGDADMHQELAREVGFARRLRITCDKTNFAAVFESCRREDEDSRTHIHSHRGVRLQMNAIDFVDPQDSVSQPPNFSPKKAPTSQSLIFRNIRTLPEA